METSLLHPSIYENVPEFILNLTAPFEGRERDVVLLSSLGVISATLPKVFGIYDGYRYSPNLYVLIIAPPASGKGIMNKSKKLIDKIHQQTMQISLSSIEDCKAERKEKKDSSITCPDLEVKVIPGNVSSSKIYKHIKSATYGLLIFETEADTISAMLKQDWGNFSDILRKAFHHETISISREIDDKFIEVNAPELSLVLSGTPNQVKPLIQSKENGLFSRFIYYLFADTLKWKDVSPQAYRIDYNRVFSLAGDELFGLYNKLQNNQTDIQIQLSESQWERFNQTMSYVTDLYIHQNKPEILPIIKRQGVIMFRICMIFTILRNKHLDAFPINLFCLDVDFEAALQIMKATIDHSIEVSNLLGDNVANLPVLETLLLAQLNKSFTRAEAISVGESIGMPPRTVDYNLNKFVKIKLLNKVTTGVYEKM